MAITRAQQAKQMLQDGGMLVKPGRGKRPGYRESKAQEGRRGVTSSPTKSVFTGNEDRQQYSATQTQTGKVKGGLSCEIGVTAFLPGSQIDTRPVRDVSHLIDVPQKFKILKMDLKRNNIVVSRRAVLEEMNKEVREERFLQIKLGDVVEGKIKAITDYGCFVDLGGYDSLLHSSDITYKRIGHPSEVLKIDQQVKVKIIKVDILKYQIDLELT